MFREVIHGGTVSQVRGLFGAFTLIERWRFSCSAAYNLLMFLQQVSSIGNLSFQLPTTMTLLLSPPFVENFL